MSGTRSSIMGRGLVLCAVLLATVSSSGSDCSGTSTGMVPINDLAAGVYLGQYQGGLYPNGLDTPPLAHHNAGVNFAHAVQLMDFFLNSSYAAPSFRNSCPSDWNHDGTINSLDFIVFLNAFVQGC